MKQVAQYHGWIIIDKPLGMSSAHAVQQFKRTLKQRRIGHAGTLDPMATGLLAIACGHATKTIPYITDALKCYEFTIRWGVSTTTDDREGEICNRSDTRPSIDEINSNIPDFIGDIFQVPPKYSAVKINGERAYKLAREGRDFEIKPKSLYVEGLKLIEILDQDHAKFELICGKGGYVRSIARDLALSLGTYGYVSDLRRTWSGPFTLNDAISENDFSNKELVLNRLLPMDIALDDLTRVDCNQDDLIELGFGRTIKGVIGGGHAWACHDGKVVALGEIDITGFRPHRVFVS